MCRFKSMQLVSLQHVFDASIPKPPPMPKADDDMDNEAPEDDADAGSDDASNAEL
jgi:hypothetical protein